MTITETAPEAEATDAPAGPTEHSGDLASVVGSGDHKRIGRLFLGTSFVGLVATLVAGLVLDVERISDTSVEIFGSQNALVQALSFQRFGLVFLFALPALLGLAMVVVPLQVGASTLAFARSAASRSGAGSSVAPCGLPATWLGAGPEAPTCAAPTSGCWPRSW
jgi:hypothetical protein